jgi:glc operon protein GlcG
MRIARLLSLVVVTVLLLASVPVAAQQPVAPLPPQIPYGVPISLEQAKKVMAGAEAESRKNNWNMVIAVLDPGGNLVMLQRMDGVQLGSIEDCYGSPVPARSRGAFPIIVDGKLIGAIGVSGHTSEQDAQVARAGADALKN